MEVGRGLGEPVGYRLNGKVVSPGNDDGVGLTHVPGRTVDGEADADRRPDRAS